MSLQLKIYLTRAGLITESKNLEKEIEDFLEYLRQHDGEGDDEEHPDEVEDDEEDDTEGKKQLKEEKEKSYTSNDKGVLHELLVGKHLMGKHMTLH